VESPLLIGGKKFAESSETALVFLKSLQDGIAAHLQFSHCFLWGGGFLILEIVDLIFTSLGSITKPYL